KEFPQAEALFLALTHLNLNVFEYWLGLATAQQELKALEDARDSYEIALSFGKHLPLLFFQLASCFLGLKEKERALDALHECIHEAEKDESAAQLMKEAIELKKTIKHIHI